MYLCCVRQVETRTTSLLLCFAAGECQVEFLRKAVFQETGLASDSRLAAIEAIQAPHTFSTGVIGCLITCTLRLRLSCPLSPPSPHHNGVQGRSEALGCRQCLHWPEAGSTARSCDSAASPVALPTSVESRQQVRQAATAYGLPQRIRGPAAKHQAGQEGLVEGAEVDMAHYIPFDAGPSGIHCIWHMG